MGCQLNPECPDGTGQFQRESQPLRVHHEALTFTRPLPCLAPKAVAHTRRRRPATLTHSLLSVSVTLISPRYPVSAHSADSFQNHSQDCLVSATLGRSRVDIRAGPLATMQEYVDCTGR